jgi:hypothetical protein
VKKHYTKAQRAELIDLVTSGENDDAESRWPTRRRRIYRTLLAQARQRMLALAVRQAGS